MMNMAQSKSMAFVPCTGVRRIVQRRCVERLDFTLVISQVTEINGFYVLAHKLSKNCHETWTRPGCGVRVRRCSANPKSMGGALRLARLGGRNERCEQGNTHHRARCVHYLWAFRDGNHTRALFAQRIPCGGSATVALSRTVGD